MKREIAVSLFVAMTAFSAMAVAQTPSDTATPPPASPGLPEQSNKGGHLRGLDRADQAAGQHGQQGRDNARDAQLNRPHAPERSGLPERPVKPDRPGR